MATQTSAVISAKLEDQATTAALYVTKSVQHGSFDGNPYLDSGNRTSSAGKAIYYFCFRASAQEATC